MLFQYLNGLSNADAQSICEFIITLGRDLEKELIPAPQLTTGETVTGEIIENAT